MQNSKKSSHAVVFLMSLFLIFTSIRCHAETAKDTATLQKELTVLAHKNNLETVKNFCVNYWIEPSRRDILSKFATVSELCECVQSDMKFTVSDDLAERLINMQIDADSTDRKLSQTDNLKTTNEWMGRYRSADASCRERFINRKTPGR